MKNIEKYHETKAAIEAYNNIDFKSLPFDMWLDCEYEKPSNKTLLEAAEAVIDRWYCTYMHVTLDDIGEKIVDLKNAIARERRNPVRNCDKYKTAKDAFTGFKEMCADKHCDRCPFSAERNECPICKLNWLYVEAEEEGGAK